VLDAFLNGLSTTSIQLLLWVTGNGIRMFCCNIGSVCYFTTKLLLWIF